MFVHKWISQVNYKTTSEFGLCTTFWPFDPILTPWVVLIGRLQCIISPAAGLAVTPSGFIYVVNRQGQCIRNSTRTVTWQLVAASVCGDASLSSVTATNSLRNTTALNMASVSDWYHCTRCFQFRPHKMVPQSGSNFLLLRLQLEFNWQPLATGGTLTEAQWVQDTDSMLNTCW